MVELPPEVPRELLRFLERIAFLERKFSTPIESYAATLTSSLDFFTQDISAIRDELVIELMTNENNFHRAETRQEN